MKYLLILLSALLPTVCTHAQVLSFKDTIHSYNRARIRTDVTGAKVLGAWGLANIAAGGIGYFTAKQDEWKYFHAMNAGFGVLNTFVAATKLNRVRRESGEHLTYEEAYKLYRDDKRHYLINACFDVVYVGAGVALTEIASKNDNPALCNGFGKSLVIQGIALLVFDNVMYAAHAKSNARWFQVMNEVRFSSSGVGFNYKF